MNASGGPYVTPSCRTVGVPQGWIDVSTVNVGTPAASEQQAAAIAPIDSDGRAKFAAVLPGSFQTEVQCQQRPTASDFPILTVREDDLHDLRWPVPIGARIVGHVVDRAGRSQPGRELSAILAEDADAP